MIYLFEPKPIEFYRGRRVCVTGASGMIGSYAVLLLRASGAHVRAIVHEREWNDFTRLADETINCDLMAPRRAWDVVQGCDTVIGCAGITGGIGLASSDPVGFVGPATVIAVNTLHACHTQKVERHGFISSTTVYPASDLPVHEGDELGGPPYSAYEGIGEAKRWLEKLCRYYHRTTGLKVAVIRSGAAYGRFDNFDERTGHVVPSMVERALRGGDQFEVWGDGQDVRDFVHAQDVARGLLMATAQIEDADPINIASGRGVSTKELAETVLYHAGSKAAVVTRPGKPSGMRVRRVDVSKAKHVLGWEPEISLDDGIRDVIEWRRSR